MVSDTPRLLIPMNYLESMSFNDLKKILRSMTLSPTGSKKDLIHRIKHGAADDVVIPLDASEPRTYEWDSHSIKHPYFCVELARSNRSKCTRCFRVIPQGTPRIGRFTWDHSLPPKGHGLYRWMHVVCFAKYPPHGVDTFDDIRWEPSRKHSIHIQDEVPLNKELMKEVHHAFDVYGGSVFDRVTSPSLVGLRKTNEDVIPRSPLKQDEYSDHLSMLGTSSSAPASPQCQGTHVTLEPRFIPSPQQHHPLKPVVGLLPHVE